MTILAPNPRQAPEKYQLLRLDRADSLPGHQSGRDQLIDMLFGHSSLAAVVVGHYEYDRFAVTDWIAIDYDDESEHWWWGTHEPFGAETSRDAAYDAAEQHLICSYAL